MVIFRLWKLFKFGIDYVVGISCFNYRVAERVAVGKRLPQLFNNLRSAFVRETEIEFQLCFDDAVRGQFAAIFLQQLTEDLRMKCRFTYGGVSVDGYFLVISEYFECQLRQPESAI